MGSIFLTDHPSTHPHIHASMHPCIIYLKKWRHQQKAGRTASTLTNSAVRPSNMNKTLAFRHGNLTASMEAYKTRPGCVKEICTEAHHLPGTETGNNLIITWAMDNFSPPHNCLLPQLSLQNKDIQNTYRLMMGTK